MYATFNGFTFLIENTGKKEYGFPIYRYQVITPEPYTIFTGEVFKPSIAAVRNDLFVPIELLQWLTISYENNDHSLFEHYTKKQLEFANDERIEEYEMAADDAWLALDNKKYRFMLNTGNIQIISFNTLHSPLVIIKD